MINQRIWKYTLDLLPNQMIYMPKYSEIVHVGVQHGKITLWAMVDPFIVTEEQKIYIFGTGHNIDSILTKEDHIGTVQIDEFVWHVFRKGGR